MKWSKRSEKVAEERKLGPHASPISDLSPCRNFGCPLALAGRYKPPARLPLLELPLVIIRHHKTAEQCSMIASWPTPHLILAAFTHTGTPQS